MNGAAIGGGSAELMFIVILQPIRALDSGHLTNQEKGIYDKTFKGVG